MLVLCVHITLVNICHTWSVYTPWEVLLPQQQNHSVQVVTDKTPPCRPGTLCFLLAPRCFWLAPEFEPTTALRPRNILDNFTNISKGLLSTCGLYKHYKINSSALSQHLINSEDKLYKETFWAQGKGFTVFANIYVLGGWIIYKSCWMTSWFFVQPASDFNHEVCFLSILHYVYINSVQLKLGVKHFKHNTISLIILLLSSVHWIREIQCLLYNVCNIHPESEPFV
jgi:hypothetical protein